MLGYLILAVCQLVIAFLSAPQLVALLGLSLGGDRQNFVIAAAAAVIVWLVGVIGSLVLKAVQMPGKATLIATLIGALIGATVVTVPALREHVPPQAAPGLVWVAGAILGFLVRR